MSSELRLIRTIFLGVVLRSTKANSTLRLPVHYRELYDHGKHDYAIVASMKVDGQAVSPLVDTGSSLLFFIEKSYLQRTLSPESCQDFIYGCYECHTDIFKQKVTITEHCDDTCAYTVQHRGALELGGQTIPDVDFGLVVGYTPNDSTPHASLGLAPRDDGGPTPLIDQLIDKGVINRPDFSIYFKPDNPNEGELILGGEDPRGQMMIAPLAVEGEWTVNLASLAAGGSLISGSIPLHIDSGTSRLWLPREVFHTLWRALEKKASEAASQAIEFRADEGNRVLTLSDPSHRVHLPPLELHFRAKLGGASTIVIPPEFYVQTFDLAESKTAILLWHIPEDFPNEAFLGLGLLRKYHLHFLYNDREIRFSEITRNKDFPDIVQTARPPQRRRRAARTLETYL
ncbi:hypothetical protein FOZ63_031792 [Perkinsus olseni]|uniref:Peptidase A1 domain-containing protein n=1 Tax=Perkinsus olseni TaxID=32597 RepID=A0A7J6Q4U3_PEROL|nr:hypothetical protein FOZ62_013853 [Perkinsus olseni]KAF4705012.1 hypothetical protein FOZ63_031792 [Perkinsus olseni]